MLKLSSDLVRFLPFTWYIRIIMNDYTHDVDGLKWELAASEDRFAKIFDASPSMIVISTIENGHHYAVNHAWLKIMGYPKDQVIGKTAHEIGVWPTREARERYIAAYKAQGVLRDFEVKLKTNGGEVRTFLTSCDEVNYDGALRLLMVFHDVTDRRNAEEALRHANEELERQVEERTRELQHQIQATQQAKAELEDSEQRLMEVNRMLGVVLDAIPVRVFWKDTDLNLMGCNRLFAMDAGFQNPRQMIGKSDFEMGWKDQAELYRADDLRVIKSKKPKLGYEELKANAKGKEIWLRTSKIPLRNLDGDVIGILGMYEDITERKAAEKELERAQVESERANQAKSQFLSSMSHELRTPLNAILGFAQLLECDPGHPLEESQRESVEHIKMGGSHLLTLINEILELAKIEAGHLELHLVSINPEQVFDEVVQMVIPLAEKRGLEFRVPVLERVWPNIMVDDMRLKQVLLNLLSNAVKYNVADGTLTLDCEQAADHLMIKVSDTGEGISPEGIAELFQPFSRLGKEYGQVEGTGIGLTITKELVEQMNGEIGVESNLGQGTVFWVKFPLDPTAVADDVVDAVDEKHELGSVQHHGTVLYVEDNEANRMLMEGLFEQFPNLRLLMAKSAEEGLNIVEAEQPDMLMLDIALPGMSGTKMLQTVRERDGNKVPIIAISAHAMPHKVEEGLQAGFDAYLTKPFNIDQLIHELERVFGTVAVED